ncbi:hypothetical protein M885DRAFT_479090 [Pelagophyceae sp. CCMP2097]|nr:hypothetical protein M885DRAFT_479090 [Pelagophyceae sp. CCMP2097]
MRARPGVLAKSAFAAAVGLRSLVARLRRRSAGFTNSAAEAAFENFDDYALLRIPRYDVIRLIDLFQRLDTDSSGTIDVFEFLMFADMERTFFATKVFQVFDANESGVLDFDEFALSLYNFCALDRSELHSFAFRLFASRRRSAAGANEWVLLEPGVDLILKAFFTTVRAQKVAVEAGADLNRLLAQGQEQGKSFTLEDWVAWAKKHSSLTEPLFRAHVQMCKRCLGEAFWARQRCLRRKVFPGQKWVAVEAQIDGCRNVSRVRRQAAIESANAEKTGPGDAGEDLKGSAGHPMTTKTTNLPAQTDSAVEPTEEAVRLRFVSSKRKKTPKPEPMEDGPFAYAGLNMTPLDAPDFYDKFCAPTRIKRKLVAPEKRNHDEALAVINATRKVADLSSRKEVAKCRLAGASTKRSPPFPARHCNRVVLEAVGLNASLGCKVAALLGPRTRLLQPKSDLERHAGADSPKECANQTAGSQRAPFDAKIDYAARGRTARARRHSARVTPALGRPPATPSTGRRNTISFEAPWPTTPPDSPLTPPDSPLLAIEAS